MSAATLYTPEVLNLATGLADYPWNEALPLRIQKRSRACGSVVDLALALDDNGRVSGIGIRSQACAIGQAAAAIFVRDAHGRTGAEIAAALHEIETWQRSAGAVPEWPGFTAIAAAQAFPGRHAAIRLPWEAARHLLCSAAIPR